MKSTNLFLFFTALALSNTSINRRVSCSAQASPSEGFRAGLRLPVGTGDHNALVPAIGLGVETRLDFGSPSLPVGFAFICSYDEFFAALPDQVVTLPDGGTLLRPQSQSLSYSSFFATGTLRGVLGHVVAHAELGAGVSIGFFHGVPTERDAEVFASEFLLSGMGGAGLSVLFGKQGVIDLLIFEDFFSFGLTAGYFF